MQNRIGWWMLGWSFLIFCFFFIDVQIVSAQFVDLYVETSHKGDIASISFSPDGKLGISVSQAAITSQLFDIKLWDVTTHRELRQVYGDEKIIIGFKAGNGSSTLQKNWMGGGTISKVLFGPDNQTIACAVYNQIWIWNAVTWNNPVRLEGHKDHVNSISFSKDGRTLASSSLDKTIKFWNVATGTELKSFNLNSRLVKFSPDGKTLVSLNQDNTMTILDFTTGRTLQTFTGGNELLQNFTFSDNGKNLVIKSRDPVKAAGKGQIQHYVKLWDSNTGQLRRTVWKATDLESQDDPTSLSDDGTLMAYVRDDNLKMFDLRTGKEVFNQKKIDYSAGQVVFSPDTKTLAIGGDLVIGFYDTSNGSELGFLADFDFKKAADEINQSPVKFLESFFLNNFLDVYSILGRGHSGRFAIYQGENRTLFAVPFNDQEMIVLGDLRGKRLQLKGHELDVSSLAFSPKGKVLASGGEDSIKLWNSETGEPIETLGDESSAQAVVFSPDGKVLASGDEDGEIKLWDTSNWKKLRSIDNDLGGIESLSFSPDGLLLASGDDDHNITLWRVKDGVKLKTLTGHTETVNSVVFSFDGKRLLSASDDDTIRLWDVVTGKKMLEIEEPETSGYGNFALGGKLIIVRTSMLQTGIWDAQTGEKKGTFFSTMGGEWIFATQDGRFDTNKSLDRIEGLHWIVNQESLKPLPVDIFMRQYYEPGLLQRVLNGEELKPLPPIGEINRVQPEVEIREIKPVANSNNLVDVTIEVTSVQDKISVSPTERRNLTSGAFDLRLFRDGQLVGQSTPAENLKLFIEKAPDFMEANRKYFKETGKLTNTPEDKVWREANDIFQVKTENIKSISPEKLLYTFKNVKLPNNGSNNFEFTAYAFNADRVKSANAARTYRTAEPLESRVGRTYLVNIGVNANESPIYNLNFAVNDANKMRYVLGPRIEKTLSVKPIEITLVSNYLNSGYNPANTARKEIVEAVFRLLAGQKVDDQTLQQIPNAGQIQPVQPEDTLIITFSGHGYANRNGIFYLMPSNIGKNTTALTPQILRKLISSDELSLWMKDITAKEMLMIVDACHSAAAVQGLDFKPAPMGSRGLGQLAYDKKMRILTATKADKSAVEIEQLQQGLLSYALLEDGILKGRADTEAPKDILNMREWLEYGERRTPELYQEVKNGILKGSIPVKDQNDPKKNYQQPHLFDFTKKDDLLIKLP